MDEKQTKTASEICTIRIIFPAKSDEQAIEYKKKIAVVLADEPDAQVHFSLMPVSSIRKPNV